MKHFDLGKLISCAVASHCIETVLKKCCEFWPDVKKVVEKWQAVSAALSSAAIEML